MKNKKNIIVMISFMLFGILSLSKSMIKEEVPTFNNSKNIENENNINDEDENNENEQKEDIKNKIENKKQDKNITICIDAGHQEKGDSNLEAKAPGSSKKKPRVSQGATGVATKKPEYILNLETSLILREILQNKGYNVIMTRETHDVNISNSERAIFANERNADFVVRIHADSLNDSSKTGACILIPSKNNKYTTSIYETSSEFSKYIAEEMKNSNIKMNGIFEREDITGFNWSKVPVVIVEMGFMSNYNEDLMMSDVNYQKKMMESIANGIDKYFENK